MTFYYLVKRNILLYFKDKAAVFFSLLSVLIVLMLMIVFLGDMNEDSLLDILQELRGGKLASTDIEHVQQLMMMWTIAGMLAVNSFTVPLTMIGLQVEDKQYHRLESFMTAPVSRIKILSGYVIAAIINGMIMCMITLALSWVYILSQGMPFLTLIQTVQVLLILFLSVTISSCIILLIAQFIKTSNAWGSLSTIMGTLIGFLGGIYLPVGMLPEMVQSLLKALPFLHEASMLRDVFTQDILQTTFSGLPQVAITSYEQVMGIQIELFSQNISVSFQVVALFLCGIITLSLAVYKLQKKTTFDGE